MITLDLPAPYSVNRTRKINWEYLKKHKQWVDLADAVVMKYRQNRQNGIIGPFQATITIDEERCRADPDNILKALFDYCKRLKLITDDSRKYLREFRVIYGFAPEGIRVQLSPHAVLPPRVTGRERKRIIAYLFAHPEGVPVQQICEVVYGDKPTGDHRSIYGIVFHAKEQLAEQGWRVRATGGPGSIYRLERIEKAAPEEAA